MHNASPFLEEVSMPRGVSEPTMPLEFVDKSSTTFSTDVRVGTQTAFVLSRSAASQIG